jgi:oligosaccharide repeat unit polymerase
MPKNQQRISTLIIWLFLILSYIPELTLYSLSNEARTWIYGITGFWLLIFGCLWVKKKSFKTVRVKDAGLLIILFIALLLTYTLLVIFSVRGLAPTISFVDIYDNRALFGTVSLPLASYVTRWTALVINPFLLVFFLLRRNYLLFLAVIIFQFLLFALLGQKIFLFSIPFVLGLDWLTKKRKLTFSLLSFSLASVIFISSLSFIFLGDLWLSAIFTNRLLILPALISFNHYDFFSQHVPAYLGHSIFRSFVHYPYDLLPWFLIGDVYFGYPSVSANTGMIADAYMNFRFWGVLFLVPLFGITLCLIDKFTKIHNYRLVLALVIMPMFTLLAGGFLTSILTTGLGLALLFLHIIPGTVTAEQQK